MYALLAAVKVFSRRTRLPQADVGDTDLLLGQEEAVDALLAAVKVFSRRSRLPQADVGDADHLLGQEEALDALLPTWRPLARC